MFKTATSVPYRPARFYTTEPLSAVSTEQLMAALPDKVVRPCLHTPNLDIAAISRTFVEECAQVHGLCLTMATYVECFSVQAEAGPQGRLSVRQTIFDATGGQSIDKLHQMRGSPVEKARLLAHTIDSTWSNDAIPLGAEIMPMDTLDIPRQVPTEIMEGHGFPMGPLGVLAVASAAKFWLLQEGAFVATAKAQAADASSKAATAATATPAAPGVAFPSGQHHYELEFSSKKLGFHLARGTYSVGVSTLIGAGDGRVHCGNREVFPVVHSTQRPDGLPYTGDCLVEIGGHRLSDCLLSTFASQAAATAAEADDGEAGAKAATEIRLAEPTAGKSIADVFYSKAIDLIQNCPRPVILRFERRRPQQPQLQQPTAAAAGVAAAAAAAEGGGGSGASAADSDVGAAVSQAGAAPSASAPAATTAAPAPPPQPPLQPPAATPATAAAAAAAAADATRSQESAASSSSAERPSKSQKTAA